MILELNFSPKNVHIDVLKYFGKKQFRSDPQKGPQGGILAIFDQFLTYFHEFKLFWVTCRSEDKIFVSKKINLDQLNHNSKNKFVKETPWASQRPLESLFAINFGIFC